MPIDISSTSNNPMINQIMPQSEKSTRPRVDQSMQVASNTTAAALQDRRHPWSTSREGILAFMFSPPDIASRSSNEPSRKIYIDGKPLEAPTIDPWERECSVDYALLNAFRHYRQFLVTNSIPADVASPEMLRSQPYNWILPWIEQAKSSIKWPNKVGASLYIYQQLYNQHPTGQPSLSKSQWLVENAPLMTGESSDVEQRGNHRKIGEKWALHFHVADFWAAFVALSGNPFIVPNNALERFLLHADVRVLLRLARTFLNFREELSTKPHARRHREAKHIFRALSNCPASDALRDISPVAPEGVPHLVQQYQWAALVQYSSSRPGPTPPERQVRGEHAAVVEALDDEFW